MLPVPFAAALLIPVTDARLQVKVVPGMLLVGVYVNAIPLVAVADKLLDNTGIGFGAATALPAGPAQLLSV
jgi:hypothetical protein